MKTLKIINRNQPLFEDDVLSLKDELFEKINNSSILVVGAAGTIGQAVTIELIKREPKLLYAVDLNENNMVELVRQIRSTVGYNACDFRTFAIDCSSVEFDALCNTQTKYDYIFNLSALKHVRSEKDPYTLMRLIDVNIFNSVKLLNIAKKHKAKNYFCVSTDKAANPVNMMGASKRIMEKFLLSSSDKQNISFARFANVAFSDGSLLHGFNQRVTKKQPIAAPKDVRRYFVTQKESGHLCMLSGIFGSNRDIYFPKLKHELHLETFSNIAIRYIESIGYEPYECSSENEARGLSKSLINKGKWPVYFFDSDTTGEKDFEEFYTSNETLLMSKYKDIGIIRNNPYKNKERLKQFELEITKLKKNRSWSKDDLIKIFLDILPEFKHKETGKYLDNRM